MIVRNWMKPVPQTIASDVLLAVAYRQFVDQNLRALVVMDDGILRGLLTRAHCLRAADSVARTQDRHEFDYFTHRLKVKDIMVRRPTTLQADDTMEYCMYMGQEKRQSQFPVLERNAVVGIITATEIFRMAAHMIGAWEQLSGVTLQPVAIERGTLAGIATMVGEVGGCLQSIYTVPGNDGQNNRIVVRFDGIDLDTILPAFEQAGLSVLETCFESR